MVLGAGSMAAPREERILSVNDLHKRFGHVVALDGASFTVDRGRILGFLGPNGAGKTTTMRCIFDLVEPDLGDVTWDGRAIDRSIRLQFGYMPEERGLYPNMKAGDQLVHFGRISGMAAPAARAAARHWLDTLGLGDRTDATIEELSHGNQQRVQLAAALIHDPVLLVLDEPFSGLDPLGVEALASTLRDLAASGKTIVFSSHQLDLVEDVCQDVAIINAGQVVRQGDLEEMKSRSTQRRLEIVVDGRPWFPATDRAQAAEGPGRPHTIVGSDAPIERILAEAAAAGTVDRFAFEPPSLTDLFREAVRP